MNMHFGSYLQQNATTRPEHVAYRFLRDGRDDEEVLTFAVLDRMVRALAVSIRRHCVPGDRALLLIKPGLDYVIAFLGCLHAGVIAVPAYPPGSTKTLNRLDAIIHDCEPRIALSTGDDVPVVTERLSEIAPDVDVVDVRAVDPAAADGRSADDGRTCDIAFLQYTSGSTGSPKGVIVSHANLVRNSTAINEVFATSRDGHVVSWLPPYHDMGLVGGILQSMFVGCTSTLMSPLHFLQRPLRWLQAISRHRATISGGPNFAYELCLRKISEADLAQLDLSCWQVAFNGAEPINARTVAAFNEKFSRCGLSAETMTPCYGLAEATLLATGSKAFEAAVIRQFDASQLELGRAQECPEGQESGPRSRRVRALVSCGRGAAGATPFVCDPESGRRLGDGEVGEICVVGGSVAQGYWRKPDATAASFLDSDSLDPQQRRFRTGDLGFLLDGELYVSGRIKDLIIVHGSNHHPADIEHSVLPLDPGFRPDGAAAFGLSIDDVERAVVVQEVERRALRNLDVAEVVAKIRVQLWQQHSLTTPAVVLVLAGSLPRTSSGKVRRHECRRQFAAIVREQDIHASGPELARRIVALEVGGELLFDCTRSEELEPA